MEGFISINRKILEWEWYTDNNVKSLFIHCLLKANFKDKNWRGNKVKRGTFITSYSNLSKELGLSVQQVRTALDKLKSTKEITSKPTNKNTLITVIKYNDYQKNLVVPTSKPTDEQQADNNQITTTNKDNKEKLLKQFLSWGLESGYDLDKVESNFLNAWDYYDANDWKNKNGKKVTEIYLTIRKVWFKDLSKFKKEIKIDKTVLMAAQQIPAQMQSLMDKHKVSEQYLRDLYASRR